MFAGISLIINSKAAGMSKTAIAYTHTIQYLIKYNFYTEICQKKSMTFKKKFPGLEIAVLNFHSFSRFFMTIQTL